MKIKNVIFFLLSFSVLTGYCADPKPAPPATKKVAIFTANRADADMNEQMVSILKYSKMVSILKNS